MLHPSIQTTVQSDMQTNHSDDVDELEKNDPNSFLLALASVYAELLKDDDQKNIPAPAQDISPEEHGPTVDLDPPSREMSPPQDSKQPAEQSTPAIDQLTYDLAQSTKKNEAYVKLIADLHEENKELRLQIKNMEDLHHTISTS